MIQFRQLWLGDKWPKQQVEVSSQDALHGSHFEFVFSNIWHHNSSVMKVFCAYEDNDNFECEY